MRSWLQLRGTSTVHNEAEQFESYQMYVSCEMICLFLNDFWFTIFLWITVTRGHSCWRWWAGIVGKIITYYRQLFWPRFGQKHTNDMVFVHDGEIMLSTVRSDTVFYIYLYALMYEAIWHWWVPWHVELTGCWFLKCPLRMAGKRKCVKNSLR